MAAMRRPPVAGITRTNDRSGSIGLPAGLIACAARKRLIGQRGNQTETMRDMIVLHYPFTRPSVTAAFKLQLPTRTCVTAETVARGSRRADPPARRRGARFERLRRPQQQQRQTAIDGGEMQFLAGLQIEPIDHAGDGLRRSRTQRFKKRPQSVVEVRRLHQDGASWIESEMIEAMPGQAAASAQSVARHHEDDFFGWVVARRWADIGACPSPLFPLPNKHALGRA